MAYNHEDIKDLLSIKKQVEVQLKKAESAGNKDKVTHFNKYLDEKILPGIRRCELKDKLKEEIIEIFIKLDQELNSDTETTLKILINILSTDNVYNYIKGLIKEKEGWV